MISKEGWEGPRRLQLEKTGGTEQEPFTLREDVKTEEKTRSRVKQKNRSEKGQSRNYEEGHRHNGKRLIIVLNEEQSRARKINFGQKEGRRKKKVLRKKYEREQLKHEKRSRW